MSARLDGRTLRVEKLRYDRSFVFAWSGAVLEHTADHVLLAARFNVGRRDLGYVVLEAGDVFLEWYFFERWYNIFQIYGDDGQLKGWYCNIGMPPELDGDTLRYVDLDLDVFVRPSGEQRSRHKNSAASPVASWPAVSSPSGGRGSTTVRPKGGSASTTAGSPSW